MSDNLIQEQIKQDYAYGFVTDVESVRAPKGLNKEVIQFISKQKNEPEWLLAWR
ncbi:MAG: Fe-S cluster assembly protein SufB, partial [Candidatus Fonsibacter ubiquis]|nr:Fe-S cluster assembly protein SufB [Candidatus Fonsibacter ubiquis]